MQIRADIVVASVLLVFCAFMWHQANDLVVIRSTQAELGVAFLPKLCVVGIALLSILLIGRAVLLKSAAAAPSISLDKIVQTLGVAALMAAYYLVYESLGFYITTYLFCSLALVVIGERRLLYVTLYPIAVIAFVHVVFVVLLGADLPTGNVINL